MRLDKLVVIRRRHGSCSCDPARPTALAAFISAAIMVGCAVDAFETKLIDRFGPLPAEAETLLTRVRVRMSARACRIDAGTAAMALEACTDFAGDPGQAGLLEKAAASCLWRRSRRMRECLPVRRASKSSSTNSSDRSTCSLSAASSRVFTLLVIQPRLMWVALGP
jgi:hypothetical protein